MQKTISYLCLSPVLVNEYDDGFSLGHSERSEESHNLSSRDPSPATAGSGTARRAMLGLRPSDYVQRRDD